MYEQGLYGISSLIIAAALFAGIILANELGYRGGRWWQSHTDEVIKEQTSSITASVLGLLALLLGFTFTMSVQRFDARSVAVIEEANAIGTAQLRISLLPEQHQAETKQLMSDYIKARLQSAEISTNEEQERAAIKANEAKILDAIWKQAVAVAETDPRPVTAGLFIQALNQMIDARDNRVAVVERHVPQIVIYLLFGVFILTCGFLGYGSGLSGRRAYVAMLLLATVIVSVMFLVIDLDRPRRGFVQVDQAPLLQLQQSLTSSSVEARQ